MKTKLLSGPSTISIDAQIQGMVGNKNWITDITRTSKYLDKSLFLNLYKALIHQNLDYIYMLQIYDLELIFEKTVLLERVTIR